MLIAPPVAKEVVSMSEISVVTALLGVSAAALGVVKAAISLIAEARKGKSRKREEQ